MSLHWFHVAALFACIVSCGPSQSTTECQDEAVNAEGTCRIHCGQGTQDAFARGAGRRLAEATVR